MNKLTEGVAFRRVLKTPSDISKGGFFESSQYMKVIFSAKHSVPDALQDSEYAYGFS